MNMITRVQRKTSGVSALTVAFLGSTCLSSLGMVSMAHAADAQTAQAPAVEEIVVTGSRVVRDGYQAPTPVSVVGVEALANTATSNLADTINQLPVLQGSTTPATTATLTTSGLGAVNGLNL